MTGPDQRQPYTAEIILAKKQGQELDSAPAKPAFSETEISAGGVAEVLQAIAALRADLSSLSGGSSAPPKAPAQNELGISAETEELKSQLADMSQAISDAKMEVASLRDPNSQSADDVVAASRELDAVVNSTEAATNEIMEAAEQIDDLAGRLSSQLSSDADKALAEEINERVIAIFEACNFQDITGQRITKVVNTLMYVDERVSKMMNLWGAVPGEATAGTDPESDDELLNGPAPEGEGTTQEDIDALFD